LVRLRAVEGEVVDHGPDGHALARIGIDAAKKKGVYKGRKPSVPVEAVRRMHGEGKGQAEIAVALGVSRMSVWRALKDDVLA
jgi:DNA invertase Pin-like site-specific DNA recombinase